MSNKPPAGLGPAGCKLWTFLIDLEPEPHELVQVIEACRIADRLEALAKVVEDEGVTDTDHRGNTRAHPALVESRQQQLALNRTLAALNIPSADGSGEWDGLSASQRARKAALARHYGPATR